MSKDQKPEFGAPYQGAREEVAIWKRRALEAEATVREQDKIIDRLGAALNEENGPIQMGEPKVNRVECSTCLDQKTVPGNISGGFVKDCPDCCGEEG